MPQDGKSLETNNKSHKVTTYTIHYQPTQTISVHSKNAETEASNTQNPNIGQSKEKQNVTTPMNETNPHKNAESET